jgi:hypothetical protein
MWEPQRLTTLWASMACYRDSFTFFLFVAAQASGRVESYVTTDGQSASLSWNKAPIWGRLGADPTENTVFYC